LDDGLFGIIVMLGRLLARILDLGLARRGIGGNRLVVAGLALAFYFRTGGRSLVLVLGSGLGGCCGRLRDGGRLFTGLMLRRGLAASLLAIGVGRPPALGRGPGGRRRRGLA